jgi:hypothetical protein
MHVPYRGDNPSKVVARWLVWMQHRHLLGARFGSVDHVFLASAVAGDVNTLRALGVEPRRVWAVEKDREQYRQLFARRKAEGFRLFTCPIEDLVERCSAPGRGNSIFLDLCGNIQGTAKTIARVIAQTRLGDVISITLFQGREQEPVGDREAALLKLVRLHTKNPITLLQSVYYMSANEGSKGSLMCVWTIFIGKGPSRSKMRFDLTGYDREVVMALASSDEAIRTLWSEHLSKAERRSQAAVLANVTRRRGT